MTATQIKTYLENEYGECRHDAFAMAAAINYIAEDLENEDKWDLFHLLVENKPIKRLMTHSYGFHTSGGRHIIESIKEKYYEYEERGNI